MCWHGPKLRTAVAAVATREAFGSSQSSFDSLRADAESVDLRHNEEGSTIIAECLCRKQPKHGMNGAAKVAGSVRNFGDFVRSLALQFGRAERRSTGPKSANEDAFESTR